MDDQYRTLMQISVTDPQVLSLIVPSANRSPHFQGQKLQQLLQAGSLELEGIIMALESVLYGFCAHFPRLFFLSDTELVALLAAPLEPCEAQIWVRRCFPHVHAVSFKSILLDRNTDVQKSRPSTQTQVEALVVLGAGGEEVKLQESLPLHPDLLKWLSSLEKCLRLALVHLLQDCVAARLAVGPSLDKAYKEVPQQSQLPLQLYVHHWLDLVEAFPWQCVLVAEEVVWRAEMEEALLAGRTLAMVPTHVYKELEHGVLSPAWEHLLLIVPRRPRGVPQCAHLAKLQCLGVHFWPVPSSPSHEECVSFGVCLCHIPLNTS